MPNMYFDVDFKRDASAIPFITQNDTTKFIVSLNDDGIQYLIMDSAGLQLISKKEDGTVTYIDGVKTNVNEITFTLKGSEMGTTGKRAAIVQITYPLTNERFSTVPFEYVVYADLSIGKIQSS
jgi:hypothetical protein